MNYANLISAMSAVIKANGNNEITGNLLQQVLRAIINSLGQGYQFMGVATTATDPGTQDARLFYVAEGPGTYSNFGPLTVPDDGQVYLLVLGSSWAAVQLPIPSFAGFSDLVTEVDGLQEKSGKVVTVDVPATAGTTISKEVEYPVYIKKGDVTILVDGSASEIIGANVLPIYKYVNGVRSFWFSPSPGIPYTRTIDEDIEGISFYMLGSSISQSGTLKIEIRQNGELDAEIANTRTLAERKIERIAWMGPSSSGHTWSVGEKIFNTTRKKLAACKSVSPVDFYDDYNPSTESLYLYNNTLYEWDGVDMKEVVSIEELQFREEAENSLKRYFSYRDFVIGSLYNGQVVSNAYAIAISDIQTANSDMLFSVASGYKMGFHFFNGSIYSSNTGYRTTDIKIDKGTRFRLAISSVGGSIPADISTFARQVSFKLVNFIDNTTQLKIFGKYSEDYQSTQGASIDGTSLLSANCLRIKIASGETFAISLSGSITSGMAFYALKADGTAQRIYENTYGYYVAPFDMEGIGVYIAGASVSSTGTYTITVEDVSLEDIKNTVYGRGVLPYWGQKIPSLSIFNRTNRCKEEILISENNTSEGNDNRNASGLVVYGNRIFSFNHGDYCMVFDKTSFALLEKAILPWSAHNNNAQPTPYFYDAGDDFPLFLVSRGDYAGAGEQKFYFVRVTENNGSFTFAIVKTVSYSGFPGEQYNCSWFANYEKNELYCYTYPNGAWSVKVNNPIVIHKFAMPSMDNYNDVTLTGDDIVSTITMLDHWIMQSCLYHDNKIYMQASMELNDTGLTINGEPYDKSKGVCFLFIIDPDSGYIETVVPLYNSIEQEGMCVCDGALYMSEKYSLAAVGSVCFRIVRYTFD